MKILVDEMPIYESDCLFFYEGKCNATGFGCIWCNGECVNLKEVKDEKNND